MRCGHSYSAFWKYLKSQRPFLGPHKGRKAFLLQSLAPRGEERAGECVAQANGFSLHAGIAAEAEQRQKLERLCRYIARPAVAIERLSRTAQGTIRYALKTTVCARRSSHA